MLPAPSRRYFETQSRDCTLPKFERLTCQMVAAALLLAPLSAQAGVLDDAMGYLGLGAPQKVETAAAEPAAAAPQETPPVAVPLSSRPIFNARAAELSEIAIPSLPSVAAAELPSPSVETPLHKLFCVEYARARSGLAVFGDAKFWWAHAKNVYARLAHPVSEAVMVFAGSKRLRSGHVAVVTNIVSPREIRVDQANWENHGEIDHATPVMDVSARNDWSQVRVWDRRSQTFGAHVYAISGFIAKSLVQKAEND
jgi:hypothetical protein